MGLAELLKMLLDQHPGIGVSLIIIACSVTWMVATNYTNFKWMRANMVSKKDMEITMLKFAAELHKTFIPRAEFDSRVKPRVNGEAHKH
jgi:hypothetical protein